MRAPPHGRKQDGILGTTARADPATVTVHVPLAFRQLRSRKVLVPPEGSVGGAPTPPRPSRPAPSHATAVTRALARAFRWRRLLETGAMATVHEIAVAECINPSYVSRILRLTLLAPEIVDVLMIGEPALDPPLLDRLMKPFPKAWQEQLVLIG